MTIDYNAITNQCIKGFKKERGQKIGDKIRWMENRSFIAADAFYVYALHYVGRKTRQKNAVKELKQGYEALNEIIKTANELKAEIKTELDLIKKGA